MMSAEQQSRAPEQSGEHQSELEQMRAEKLQEIKQQAENQPESQSAEQRAEHARQAIEKHTEVKHDEPVPAPEHQEPEPVKVHPMLDPILNYRHTLASLQTHLRPASRTFSKVIHNPAVESTSEALEKTVARPSVLNGALWTALLLGGIFYITARMFGYHLSGSEMLFALIAGGVIGVLAEIIWRAFKRAS